MLELDEKNYSLAAEQTELPVLIGLYTQGRPMAEGFEPLAERGSGKLKFCKLDIHAQPALADQLCGRGQPSLLLLQGGEIAQRLRGNYDCPSLTKILGL